MSTAIVNARYFWDILKHHVADGFYTVEQRQAVEGLERIVKDRDLDLGVFAELTLADVQGILSITVHEVDDRMRQVINGSWFRVAIEEDGYTVLTGSSLPVPVTGSPVTL